MDHPHTAILTQPLHAPEEHLENKMRVEKEACLKEEIQTMHVIIKSNIVYHDICRDYDVAHMCGILLR